MAPSVPFSLFVNIKSAPSALIIILRSSLIPSDIIIVTLYPLNVPIIASEIPMLPLDASKIVIPFFNSPLFSACSII